METLLRCNRTQRSCSDHSGRFEISDILASAPQVTVSGGALGGWKIGGAGAAADSSGGSELEQRHRSRASVARVILQARAERVPLVRNPANKGRNLGQPEWQEKTAPAMTKTKTELIGRGWGDACESTSRRRELSLSTWGRICCGLWRPLRGAFSL
jgi:hypothetical protein